MPVVKGRASEPAASAILSSLTMSTGLYGRPTTVSSDQRAITPFHCGWVGKIGSLNVCVVHAQQGEVGTENCSCADVEIGVLGGEIAMNSAQRNALGGMWSNLFVDGAMVLNSAANGLVHTLVHTGRR
jgi:hypothetical protein